MLSFTNENILRELFASFEVQIGTKLLKEINNSTLTRSLLITLSFEKILKSFKNAEVIFEKEEKDTNNYSIGTLPNDDMVLVEGNKIKFFNLINLQKIRTLETEEKIDSMLMLSNGNILTCKGTKFNLWDNNNEYNIATAYYYKDTPEIINLDTLFQLSNGNIACCARLEDSHEVLIFNHNFECIKVFKKGKNQSIYAFANLPSNRFVYLSGVYIKILDVNNDYECFKILVENRDYITSLLFIEKNNMLLSGACGYFNIWDINNFKCIKTVWTKYEISRFLPLPCGYIACGMSSNIDGSFIEIWDINEWQCVNVLKTGKVGISSLLFKNNMLICATRDNLLRWEY
jgi:WD40 repeat protein